MYWLPLAVRAHDACLDTVGVVVSGAENSLFKVIGVLPPRFTADRGSSMAFEGSSTSFSALGMRVFLEEDDDPSSW